MICRKWLIYPAALGWWAVGKSEINNLQIAFKKKNKKKSMVIWGGTDFKKDSEKEIDCILGFGEEVHRISSWPYSTRRINVEHKNACNPNHLLFLINSLVQGKSEVVGAFSPLQKNVFWCVFFLLCILTRLHPTIIQL